MKRVKHCVNILSKEFINFGRETTIHGFPILVAKNLHPLERLFWSCIIGLAMYAAVQLSVQNVNRYYANPTVVSIQKDYRNWFNTFPSATACFVRKADAYYVEDYIQKTWGINDTDTKYEYYKEFVLVVANISYRSLHGLTKFAQDKELNDINLLDLAARVHPKLSGNLVTFDTERSTNWEVVMTELGICFSMNTKLSKHFTYKVTSPNSIIIGSKSSNHDDYILQCHYLNGLCYARYDSDPTAPLQIYIHSYLDIAHATSEEPLQVKESQELEINFKMQQTSASINLRRLSPSQRKCRFDDEPITADMPAYSNGVCYMTCRYRLVMKLCGCRPFFYHNLVGKLCDLSGLLCVARHSKEITKPPSKLGCRCPEPCDFIQYLPQSPKITVWEYGYFDQRLTFRWGLLPPTTKYHRDIIFGFEDLVVSIGGALALFLGMSFITAMEIMFFVIHLIRVIIFPPKQQAFPPRMFAFMKNENINVNNNKSSKQTIFHKKWPTAVGKPINRGTLSAIVPQNTKGKDPSSAP